MAGTEDGTAAGGNGQARLPEAFLEKMKELLGQEYGAFLETYSQERKKGLRLNPLKVTGPSEVQMLVKQFGLWKIPWAEEGYYYDEKARPGKHAWHEAGVFYIQEPSAMAVAEFLEAEPGEKVLDLCAAPGGKTTQIAGKLLGQGLLVSNEIHPARAKILSRNVERMGIANAVVTNEEAGTLADRFPAFFDKIVVDAPCSGEGMFRKDEEARTQWSREHVLMCARRQGGILDLAGTMVRPGGRIVYSTCTFSPEENEGVVNAFLERNPEFYVEQTAAGEAFDAGVPLWVEAGRKELAFTCRIWPHHAQGEGHFAAVLRKAGEERDNRPQKYKKPSYVKDAQIKSLWREFCLDTLSKEGEELFGRKAEERMVCFGDQLYLVPGMMPDFAGLRILRAGLHLGTIKKNRFEPSHGLALYLKKEQVKRWQAWGAESRETAAYMGGETLEAGAEGGNGWTLVLAGGYSIGWAKKVGGILKNHYPKGLRSHDHYRLQGTCER